MTRTFTDAELLERASLRVAMHIRGLYEERGGSDTRLLESLFIPDNLVVAGRSRKLEGKGHREHVVPRLVIIKECHEMVKRREGDEAIAKFIRDHVKIVHITEEERLRLDSRHELGLRQKMPEGWVVGSDIYARLSAAEIEWDPS